MNVRVRPISIIKALSVIGLIAVIALLVVRPTIAQTASVNWSNIIGSTTHMQFATNDVVCDHPSEQYEDTTWCNDMASAKFGFIRLHDDIVDDWTSNNAWSQTLVSNALNCSYVKAIGGGNTMICINKCPSWCENSDGSVNQAEYASFCASLVTLVNKTLGMGVHYWEPMNEPDQWPQYVSSYNYTGTNGLCPVFNACASAMTAVDSSIVVGGPTCSYWNTGLQTTFLQNCWSTHLGFLSFHDYDGNEGSDQYNITGNLSPYNATSEYNYYTSHARDYGSFISTAASEIASARPNGDNHTVLVDNDEWNYAGYWYSGWMQQFNQGACFDAAALTSEIDAGVGISAIWCDKDDTYGLWCDLDTNDDIMNPAYLFTWCNNYMVGQLASSTSSDADVSVLPVVGSVDSSGHTNYILLSNTSASANNVVLTHGMPYPQTAELDLISSAMGQSLPISAPSVTNPSITGATYTVDMPAFSVALLRMTASAPGTPTNLTATPGNATVTLNWTGASGDATYNVYRGTTSGGETQLTYGLSSPTYTDTTVSNGITYYYYVKGVNSAGNQWSSASNEVLATPSSIVYKQGNSNTAASGTTITCAYSSAQTAGDMNIIAIGSESPSLTVSSVTDSLGNAYTKAVGPTTSAQEMQYIYYAPNIKSGSNTVTVNFSGSTAWPDIRITEYSGVNALDQTATGTGNTGSTASTSSATTTQPNELLFMGDYTSSNTTGVGSGYTIRVQDGYTDVAADKIVSSTGSYSASATLGASTWWVIQLATFYASTAPGTPTNLQATAGNGQVSLTWTAASGDATFNVYRGTSPGGETQYASGLANPSYTDTAANNGTTYYYYVKGVNSGGTQWSAGSNEVSARPVAPLAYKQGNSNTLSSGSSITCAYSSSQTAGDMNIIAIGSESPSMTITSVTDSAGNAYTKAVGPTTSAQDMQYIYYAPLIKGGSNTVTVNFSGSEAWPDIRITEYSGVYALDKTATGTGNTGSTASTGSVTTSVSRELLFMGDYTSSNTTGVGSGYTIRVQDGYTDVAADDIVSSAGSYSASATLGASTWWVIQLATFE